MLPIPLERVREARNKIASYLVHTPLMRLDPLLATPAEKILVKAENFQRTGSFKMRGAITFLLNHLEEAKRYGVVAASAGNHGQAVAAACRMLGVTGTIVMPTHTPALKTEATRRFGARVDLVGTSIEECFAHARDLSKKEGSILVHAFADADVISGQGTVALEMAEDPVFQNIEAVVCPVGGGGLISGITSVLRQLRPEIKIYAVAAKNVPTSWERYHGEKTPTAPQSTLAEGVAIKAPNDENMAYLKKELDDFFVIGEEAIAHAISVLAESGKMVVEGAGALPLAALLEGRVPEKRVALVISGGNIDLPTLSRVLQRGLVEQGRLTRLVITGDDRPGLLHTITRVLYEKSANIVEVHHTRGRLNIGVGDAEIEVDMEIRTPADTQGIMDKLREQRLRVERVF